MKCWVSNRKDWPGTGRGLEPAENFPARAERSDRRRITGEVAKVLKVPVEAIKNFDEEAAVNMFQTHLQTLRITLLPSTITAT